MLSKIKSKSDDLIFFIQKAETELKKKVYKMIFLKFKS